MKEIRINFISPSLKKGGAENQLVKLAVYLKKRGYNVTIITVVHGNDFNEILTENRILLLNFSLKRPYEFYEFFIHFKSEKPDLLISFMFSANIIARALKFIYKFPIITSVRANEISNLYFLLYRLSYRMDDLSTFNSMYSYQSFIKRKISVEDKSLVINNGIEIDENFIKTNYATENYFILISIAHFRKSKDYTTLFKALSILKNRGFKVKLTVLGNLFEQKWPAQMIKDLNIEDEVELIGYTSKTEDYILNSDTLVLSSYIEGTPNALLEAMSKRVPIIASDIPGNDLIVKESNAGFLFKVSDEIDLTNKIESMINKTDKEREELGENGYIFIKRSYGLDHVLATWQTSLDKLVQSNER